MQIPNTQYTFLILTGKYSQYILIIYCALEWLIIHILLAYFRSKLFLSVPYFVQAFSRALQEAFLIANYLTQIGNEIIQKNNLALQKVFISIIPGNKKNVYKLYGMYFDLPGFVGFSHSASSMPNTQLTLRLSQMSGLHSTRCSSEQLSKASYKALNKI